MFSFKRFVILILMAVILTAVVSAQRTEERRTVEESYIQDAIEVMIIRETARSNNRESKQIALEYIGEALERGNTNDEIRETLVYLSNEGRRNVMRESGRNVNNFPEVRRSAARYLGQVGSEEARKNLIEILQWENEPMVIQEAIKSLGDIGTNEGNETVNQIAWAFRRFDVLNPDNIMAVAVIDSFEKIAKKSGGLSNDAVQTLIRIAEGNYITPVRERARQLIAALRSYGK